MIVPDVTLIERPSWSIPVDAIFVSVDEGVEVIAGNLASIDPYCRSFSRRSLLSLAHSIVNF